jgi:hypothetical protein
LRSLTLYRSGTPHPDLWHVFQFVTAKLGSDTGCPELALPPLGSFLWSAAQSTPDLLDSLISNRHFLEAIQAIAFVQDGNVRRAVDYKNLGSEELGSVYQGLLEMHPRINADAGSFELDTAAGNERKTSGSYYTPDSLVQCLLDSALEPVIAERLAEARRMASGEWGMVDGVARIAFVNYANQRLSRPGGLAARTGADQETVSTHGDIPRRGEVRADLTTAPGGDVHPLEYSGGLGTALHGGVHPVPPQSQRQPDGSGDAAHSERGLGVRDTAGSGQPAQGNDAAGQKTAESGTFAPEANSERQIAPKPGSGELRIANGREGELPPHSPLTIHHSPSADEIERHWKSTPLAIRHSLFAEQVLLALKVCDMAAGSGHFIIRAGHRIARHLARVRSGEEEPSPRVYQTALRDVIGHCLYGVDINPMAVELCKVTLWLEALEPGKPLSFLDHHIRCGNSLLGATPELIAAGLPDDAFEAIEGDDKAACASLKKLNRAQREGLRHMFIAEDTAIRERLHQAAAAIDEISDSRPEDIHRKEAAFRSAQTNYDFGRAWDLANLWCAAFVIKKHFAGGADSFSPTGGEGRDEGAKSATATLNEQPLALQGGLFGGTEELPKSKGKKAKASSHADSEIPIGITTQNLRDFVEGGVLPEGLLAEAKRLADQFQFFHFHLAFPEVSAQGGFDVSFGNPPWERVKLQEKEWFAERRPEIANAPNASARKRLMEELKAAEPVIYQLFLADSRKAEGESHLMRHSGLYPLCGCGDVNTFAVFAELNRKFTNRNGYMACVLPLGIVTDDTTKDFFRDLVEKQSLVSVFGFINEQMLFEQVLHNFKFCILVAAGGTFSLPARFAFNCYNVEETKDPERWFNLTPKQILQLNPETGTCPTFFFRRSAELTLAIYRRFPIFASAETGWDIELSAMLHMGEASALFSTSSKSGYRPVYESKMIHQFNHRFASYHLLSEGERSHMLPETPEELFIDPDFSPSPCYYCPESEITARLSGKSERKWMIASRRITSAGLYRTCIYAIVPLVGASDSMTLAFISNASPPLQTAFVASMNSFVFDFVTRQKQAGANLSFFVKRQLPIIPAPTYAEPVPWDSSLTLEKWIFERVFELTYTAWDLEAFAQDCGWSGPPFRWDEERRFLLRCELDAAFFHLYLGPETEWRQQPAALTQAFPTPRAAVFKWRDPSSDHNAPELSANEAQFLVRCILDVTDVEERKQIERRGSLMRDRASHTENSKYYERRIADSLSRAQTELPGGQTLPAVGEALFVDVVVKHAKELATAKRKPVEAQIAKLDIGGAETDLEKAIGATALAQSRYDELSPLVAETKDALERYSKNEKPTKADEDALDKIIAKLRPDRAFCEIPVNVALLKCPLLQDARLATDNSGPVPENVAHLGEAKREHLAKQFEGLKRNLDQITGRLNDCRKNEAVARKRRDDLITQRTNLLQQLTAFDEETASWRVRAEDAELSHQRLDYTRTSLKEVEEEIEKSKTKQDEAQRAIRGRQQELVEVFLAVCQFFKGAEADAELKFTRDEINARIGSGGGAYNALSSLAFDWAALIARLNNIGNHPGFLIHDSPRESDMELSLYRPLFDLAKRLEDKAGKSFQYLITTTEPPPVGMTTAPHLCLMLDASTPEGKLFKENL